MRRQNDFRLLMFLAVMAILGSIFAGPVLATKPNVILVMTDDQGYGDVGAHGNTIIKTPNIDKLHGESVRLTNYHVDPTCSPTRSALMTGRYSRRVGVWHTIMGRSILDSRETTMGNVFADNGYATAMFGKWHLGDNYPYRPGDRGFQEVLCNGGGGVTQMPDYWGNDYFDDTYFRGKDRVPEKKEGYCTDVWFDEAMKFIEKNKDRPFFTYLATNAPHGPFLVAENYVNMYKGKPGVPNAAFWGMITNIDDNMARLRAKLDELGLTDNTILIFTTDNGTAAGHNGRVGFNAGMRGKKGSEYEGGHRVPMFFYWPNGKLTGGRDVPELTAHVDMIPTLVELCGLKNPEGIEFDGKSVAPLLNQDGKDWPERRLCVESQRIDHPEKWRKCAVMTQRWRLVNGKELYDIQADPGQKNNIAADHPDVVADLTATYEKWWADVSKDDDRYRRIVLGNPAENPTLLRSHDWHSNNVPWNQRQIASGPIATGIWAVDVEKDGKYEFELRRWPKVADKPLGEALKIQPVKIQVTVGDVVAEAPADAKATCAKLVMDLKAGPAMVQANLVGEDGKVCGAYYTYVKRLDD